MNRFLECRGKSKTTLAEKGGEKIFTIVKSNDAGQRQMS